MSRRRRLTSVWAWPSRVFTKAELLGYIDWCRGKVRRTLDALTEDAAARPLPGAHRYHGTLIVVDLAKVHGLIASIGRLAELAIQSGRQMSNGHEHRIRRRLSRKVYVVGVGVTKFEKPGSKEWGYPDMALEAGTKALEDAGIPYDAVEQACVGYVYGDSTCGQRAVYGLGLTGIPVYNVNNNCSTGSTALFMSKQLHCSARSASST